MSAPWLGMDNTVNGKGAIVLVQKPLMVPPIAKQGASVMKKEVYAKQVSDIFSSSFISLGLIHIAIYVL
jgi:hypothetical protein